VPGTGKGLEMKRLACFAVVLFFVVFPIVGCEGGGSSGGGGGGGDGGGGSCPEEKEVWSLTNTERAKQGLTSLKGHAGLDKVAKAHSEVMRGEGRIFHEGGPDGTPSSRVRGAGIQFSMCGENVACGQTSPAAVMTAWMNSPGHRKNILNSGYTHLGVGLAMPGYYWTQVFISK
jgi:uncharacterized protein YkwD